MAPTVQKPVHWSIIAATFILLEVAAVGLLAGSSSIHDIWITRFSHRVMGWVWGSSEKLRDFLALEEQNAKLAEENFRMAEELRYYRQMSETYMRSEELLRYGISDNHVYTLASIVKISRNTQHNYIILDKGSVDGVKPNSGIISNNGVIGIVDAVGKHFCYGRTLMNSGISVSARIGKTGAMAPMSWDGIHTNIAILRNLPPHYEVAPGDTVWTSGISTVFPADIPLGITRETRLVNGSTNEVNVELFEDFAAIRYVTIVSSTADEEIREMEQ